MKYLSVNTIVKALHRVNESNTQEHRTGTPCSGLLHHYFPLDKYIMTPEQIQPVSRKRPDFSIEILENDKFIPHLFVEIKSLVNSNFNDIMDQLYRTVLETVDLGDTNFSVFVIAMKGTKIAFFEFHSFVSLLDEYGINNYNGFVPLSFRMPGEAFFEINKDLGITNLIKYLKYRSELDIPIDVLNRLGVLSTTNIPHPHIWDLLNKDHEDYIHKLFMHMANNKAGKDIV